MARWKFMSNTAVIPHCSICSARSHSNWGIITAARLRESGASDAGEPGMGAGHEAKMCAAREPRRFNGLCDTCCWLGHLSCDCLLQRDRIYSDVPTLSSPPVSPPSYSGRSRGPGYDIPCSPPQYSGSQCYRAKPFVRRYSGGDGTALSPQQQPAPRPFSSFVRDQRYSGGHSTAPPQQPAPRPLSSFVRDQRYNGGHSTAPPQ